MAPFFDVLWNILAEREGFEPSIRRSPYTRFPGVRLQPLGHLSKSSHKIAYRISNIKVFIKLN